MARRIALFLGLSTALCLIVSLILFWDCAVLDFTLRHRSSAIADIAWVVSLLGSPLCYVVPAAVLFLFFKGFMPVPIYANRALFVMVASTAPALFSDLLALYFGRSPPTLYLEQRVYEFRWFQNTPEFASFPSEHATVAAAMAAALSMLLPAYRVTFVLLALLVAASRVVLIVHFPSDVLAGLVIGFSFVLLLRKIFERYGLSLHHRAGTSSA